MFRKYILVLFAISGVMLTQYALAIPSGAVPSLGLELEKTVYSPDENVTIHVWGAGSLSGYNGTIFLRILDATTDLAGDNIVFQKTKNLTDNSEFSHTHINYTIPSSFASNSYRFLVQVYQNQTDCCPLNSAYFATKEGAEKIVISDVKLLTPQVTPNQSINFTAKVTDGLGNDVKNLNVRGDLPDSNGKADYLFTDATYDNSTKSFVGSIMVPKSWDQYANQLGQYHLRISAHAITDKGLMPAVYSNDTVNIVASTIPEFPFAIPILLVSITTMILFYRLKFKK